MAKSRQEKWIMVRLRRETHRKLLDLERRWINAYTEGRTENVPAPDDRDGIGIDRLVAELIRRDAEHRRRSKESGTRRRKTTLAPGEAKRKFAEPIKAEQPKPVRHVADDSSPAEGVQFGPRA